MRRRSGVRARRVGASLIVAGALATSLLVPSAALAASSRPDGLIATLDGRPLRLSAVANWYCDDFSYPVITCFSDPDPLEVRTTAILSTSSIEYVTIYDFTSFTGSYMHVSQDYPGLWTIGWNDRISSFIARNSIDGHFFTDWFYGGTGYYFCCNQTVSSLGSFDNTFSSVHDH